MRSPSLHVAVHVKSVLTVSVTMRPRIAALGRQVPERLDHPVDGDVGHVPAVGALRPVDDRRDRPDMLGRGASARARGQQEDDYTKAREKEPAQAVPGTLRALASPQV